MLVDLFTDTFSICMFLYVWHHGLCRKSFNKWLLSVYPVSDIMLDAVEVQENKMILLFV